MYLQIYIPLPTQPSSSIPEFLQSTRPCLSSVCFVKYDRGLKAQESTLDYDTAQLDNILRSLERIRGLTLGIYSVLFPDILPTVDVLLSRHFVIQNYFVNELVDYVFSAEMFALYCSGYE